MPSVNSAIKGRSQRHPSKPYQIPRSRSLVSNREGSQTTHSSLSSRSSYSQTSQVPIPSTSSNFTAGHNSCLDSSRCRERPRKVRKLRRNPTTPVEPPVPEPPHCAHPSPRVKSPETPAEHLPPIQYIPRDKPLLASANDIYAKDLVAQSVAMVQEIWLLPPDPPLPLGIYLQGHGPPSHTAPPNYEPPQPVVVHGPVPLEAQHIATPPFLPTPSPTNSTSDTTMEESSDEASNASTSPTLAGPPPPLTHAEPQHQHHYPAPYAPHVTMGPAQQAATFTNNLLYFIHEVVRRSRTTCTTLEVAMCYIGAVRPNVRQVLGDRENVCRQARVLRCHPCQIDVHRVYNSPLHDARRTFLASLVLASKFQQDRAYSNKAWAKLSGLPAQEVTRCETALGNALQWRLWVGRHVQVAPGATNTNTGRATFFQPSPQIITPVPGIVSSGRCLSPPICNISVDMLEAELFQEELQAGGIHTAHGPNGIPGEGDVVAERLMAAAREELRSHASDYSPQSIRRHATEPSLCKPSVSLCEGIPRSRSYHPEEANAFLPIFEPKVTLPGAYANSCQRADCGIPWSSPGQPSLEGSPAALASLDDWLIDDPDAESSCDIRTCSGPEAPCGSGPTLYPDSDMDAQSTLGGTETSSTAASTPAGSPILSLKPKAAMDLEMPPTPRLSEAYLPVSSVVGAFRVPRTPIPLVVAPAFGQETAWFPPPHFLTKLAAYTPPTEYRLLPQIPPSSPPRPSKAKSPLPLHGALEPSAGILEGATLGIDSSPFHCGSSPRYGVAVG